MNPVDPYDEAHTRGRRWPLFLALGITGLAIPLLAVDNADRDDPEVQGRPVTTVDNTIVVPVDRPPDGPPKGVSVVTSSTTSSTLPITTFTTTTLAS